MYFLVNASPFKELDITTLQAHRSHDEEGTHYWASFCMTLSKVKKYIFL